MIEGYNNYCVQCFLKTLFFMEPTEWEKMDIRAKQSSILTARIVK